MLNKLPTDILRLLFTFFPKEKQYKFFLINKECRSITNSKQFRDRALYYGSRAKFYQLVKISTEWKSEYDLARINLHYKFVEEYFNEFNKQNKEIKTPYCSEDRKKRTFNEYFDSYCELYMRKRPGLIQSMTKYNVV